MRTFYQFLEHEQFNQKLASTLLMLNIDVDKFCEDTLQLAKHDILNEDSLNELFGGRVNLGGLSNIAAGAAGLAGGLGRYAGNKLGQAGSAIGRGIGQAGSAVGRGIGQAASAVGQAGSAVGRGIGQAASAVGQAGSTVGQGIGQAGSAIGNKLGQAASAVGQAGSAVGKGIGQQVQQAGNYMAQSKQTEQLKQANNAVKQLQQQLAGFGIPQNLLQSSLTPLLQAIEQEVQKNAALGHRVGQEQQPAGAPPVAGAVG